MARKIEVVDYRPEWKEEYRTEAKKLKKALGKNCVAVYHIGSTSVPGMKAKPIIDMMPVVKDLSQVDACNEKLEALGYERKGEFGIPGRRFLIKGGDQRTHHVHIFEMKNQEAIRRHLAVQAYLTVHQERAAEYAALKEKLAKQFPYDNDGYCEGKASFMETLERDALEWKKKQDALGQYISYGMCFGMMFGCVFGVTLGNIGTGIALGICFGLGISAVMWSGKNSE